MPPEPIFLGRYYNMMDNSLLIFLCYKGCHYLISVGRKSVRIFVTTLQAYRLDSMHNVYCSIR